MRMGICGLTGCGLLVAVAFWCFVGPVACTPCDANALKDYGWCEQSECRHNCSCRSSSDCKQYCGATSCDVFKCRSHRSCLQRLHTEVTGDTKPRVKRFLARAPIMLQECPSGTCDNLIAARISALSTQVAFQNCVGGHCDNVLSFVDLTKQFCSSCGLMLCADTDTLNCTQKCVAGKCDHLRCHSRHCEQMCSHGSTCSMECPPGSETCHQTCQYGSTCQMTCRSRHCTQECKDTSKCNVTGNASTQAPSAPTTQSTPTTKRPSIPLVYTTHTRLRTTQTTPSTSTQSPSSVIVVTSGEQPSTVVTSTDDNAVPTGKVVPTVTDNVTGNDVSITLDVRNNMSRSDARRIGIALGVVIGGQLVCSFLLFIA